MINGIDSERIAMAPTAEDRLLDGELSLETDSPASETRSMPKPVELGEEFYKRVGFYCAFNEDPAEEFRRALANLAELVRTEMDALGRECDSDIQRFIARRREANEKVEEIKRLLLRYEAEIPILEADLPNLRASLEEVQQGIMRAIIEIGARKETLIEDRQTALLAELNRLNQELEAVLNKRTAINEALFLKQKDVLDEKRRFWCALFAKYEKEHAGILEKRKMFGLFGNHNVSSSFLLNSGLFAAAGAGAFFAFFAEKNAFASGGVLSFVIKAILTFSTEFIGQPLNAPFLEPVSKKVVYAGILLIAVLALLGLVVLVSCICQWIYQKTVANAVEDGDRKAWFKLGTDRSEDDTYAVEINLGEREDSSFRASLAERTVLGFWIKVIPALLILAIGFLLVALGAKVESFESLDASLAGYGIGVMAALGSAGVFYIYLTMVIEGRVSNRAAIASEAGAKVPWLRLNVELALVVLAFVAAVLFILVFFEQPFAGIARNQSSASLMLFMVSCLFTAFTLGFGIRFQGLELAKKSLETKCAVIQTKIIRISRPTQTFLSKRENEAFNTRFIEIRNEVMRLMLSHTKLTATAVVTPLVERRRPDKPMYARALDAWLWVKDKLSPRNERRSAKGKPSDATPQPPEDGFNAAAEIAMCFPKLEAELNALQDTAREIRARISSTEREIGYRKEQNGPFFTETTHKLRWQERRLRNYDKAITNREKRLDQKVRKQKEKGTFLEQKLIEGYALGKWLTDCGSDVPRTPSI